MTTIDIPITLLEACLVIAPSQEIRDYLCSVTIADGAIVATDGHRMFACELDGIDKDLQVIIPKVNVVSFIKKLDKNDKKRHARLTVEKEDSAWLTLAQVDDDGEVKLFDTKEWFKPIDAKYPAWRKVLPTQPPKDCFPYFNWKYLLDMEKISKILGAKSGHFNVMVTGLNAAAEITFPLTDYAENAVGVIMPKRN